MTHTQIAAFARMAKENALPTRTIYGQKSLLGRDAHDVRYDEVHDELFVTNRNAQAILVFRGGANGEEAPIRVIQGPHTQLGSNAGGDALDRLDVDPVHNEIFLPNNDSVLVFPRDGNGDVAPIRVIKGPDTQFRAAQAVAVDTVHDVLVVGGTARSPERGGSVFGGLLVYDRTVDGNAKPRHVIGGPKSGIIRVNQIQVYSPKGWIVATQPGIVSDQEPKDIFIGVWSINDNGEVPPRWQIGGPKSTLKKPRGVALDPKHKEMIVADMRLNAILTFSFPEIF